MMYELRDVVMNGVHNFAYIYLLPNYIFVQIYGSFNVHEFKLSHINLIIQNLQV